jgi:hypothetical protein
MLAIPGVMTTIPVAMRKIAVMSVVMMCVVLVMLVVVRMVFVMLVVMRLMLAMLMIIAVAPLGAVPPRAAFGRIRHRGQRNEHHGASENHCDCVLFQHRPLLIDSDPENSTKRSKSDAAAAVRALTRYEDYRRQATATVVSARARASPGDRAAAADPAARGARREHAAHRAHDARLSPSASLRRA